MGNTVRSFEINQLQHSFISMWTGTQQERAGEGEREAVASRKAKLDSRTEYCVIKPMYT